MGMHGIHIQAQRDPKKQWVTTEYKITNEEFYSVIEYWPVEWQFAANDEDLSDLGDGPPTDFPKETEVPNKSKEEENSQDESSSTNPIESKLEKQHEEPIIKHLLEQRESSNMAGIYEKHMKKVLIVIITATSQVQAKIK